MTHIDMIPPTTESNHQESPGLRDGDDAMRLAAIMLVAVVAAARAAARRGRRRSHSIGRIGDCRVR